MTARPSALNCTFSKIPLSGNFHKRLEQQQQSFIFRAQKNFDAKKNETKYRILVESLGSMLKL